VDETTSPSQPGTRGLVHYGKFFLPLDSIANDAEIEGNGEKPEDMLKFLRMEFNEVCGKACGENASTVVDEATSPRMLGRVALSTTSKGTFSSAGRPTPGESIRQCST